MPDPLPLLSGVDQRILGSLLEKERTVPASYPLTLNALRSACNQSSSRDPVVSYDDDVLLAGCRDLKERGLLRIVWADRGPRTLKYHQVLAERLDLADDERALLTVLLLRGPQAAGELRTRTERLYGFGDRSDVEACLARMAGDDRALVRELPRRAGERDHRWVHLLGDDVGVEPTAEPPARAVEIDLTTRDDRVRSAYDAVAEPYADRLADELRAQPFERWLLERTAALAGDLPVVEVGCGPGHVTAYLDDLGADATGIDLAPQMVAQAQRRFPGPTYQVGDLRRLTRPPAAGGWGAVLAWYALVHTTVAETPDVLAQLVRPIASGGWLVYAGLAGTSVEHLAELDGRRVDLDYVRQEPAAVAGLFAETGLVDVEWYRRGPIAALAERQERVFVVGRVP